MSLSENRIVEQLRSIATAIDDATNAQGDMEAQAARRQITRARAAIERLSPPDSAYAQEASGVFAYEDAAPSWIASQLGAIVSALADDYEHGGLLTVAELVHADVFDDFLELAGELLDKGYVAPAAVVAGSVLEEHLRKLADKREVARVDDRGRPKSVETLSVELRNADEFTELQRKSVQAWYAQRTAGAHGEGDRLIAADVERMIDGIRDFVARHPA
jgi:hypothetical protein